MISAQDALSSIEKAGRGLREDEDRLGGIIEHAAAETARLRSEQSDLFRALAQIRLDTLQREPITDRLDAAERKVLAALEEQREKLDALARQHESLRVEVFAAEEARSARAAAVNDAADSVAARVEATEKRLTEEISWQAQSARLAGAEARAEAAEVKAQRAETDRDEKSKPYLADRLFSYLWQRGYGTARYRAGPITRIGDNFVARVVNYEPARQSYFTLTEIPRRLREHADRLQAEVSDEEAMLAALERAALEQDGIVALENRQQEAEHALDAAENELTALKSQQAALEQERQQLLADDDKHGLMGALDELAASLQREDLRRLMQEAMQTPTQEDERTVHRLQKIEDELHRWEREAEEARRAAIDLARKRAELDRSREEFRRSGYDRRGGGFSNEKLIGDILGGIIGGVLSSRELRDALRSGYRPGRSSSSSRGGGSGFGSRSGGRSRSGGGFRTGGRF